MTIGIKNARITSKPFPWVCAPDVKYVGTPGVLYRAGQPQPQPRLLAADSLKKLRLPPEFDLEKLVFKH